MAASDAIVVGEEWISEHYFSTDGKQSFQVKVNDRRKEWDAAAKERSETTRSRWLAARGELLGVFAGFGETGGRFDALPGLYEEMRRVLGYRTPALQRKKDGPVEWVHATGLEAAAPLVILEAVAVKDVESLLAKGDPVRPKPADRTLLEPYQVDEKTQIYSVARLMSHLFVQEDAPEFALVLAGGWALVAERSRWPEGRYLAVDLQLVAERADDKRGGETDRALVCLDAASLAPDAQGSLWWPEVLEESINHTVGVSQDLREGVRLSIEIIANEVVRRRVGAGLEPLAQDAAQPLAKQSLRYLYRILFLLYAEASPELGVLPVGDPVYEQGYSLDRLRELVLVDLADQRAMEGRHLYESLATLFRLVDRGHDGGGATGAALSPAPDSEAGVPSRTGLTFHALRADLFKPEAISLIAEVGLGNAALQRVLRHLLLSKEVKGKDRGFISYAELGINQLGAVYEGLMSYTGFFAEDDLYEVAKGGDASKGSWVVPVERAHTISDKNDFVRVPDPVTGEPKPVLHERGTFVFRLAGRERQQSASYYTPEVLTRFTVGQALEELLDQEVERPDGTTEKRITPARKILDLTVCEPALGSGAFAIEAVRQLAAEYLKRRQHETGRRIDPDAYPRELQKVKAYIALHNVYGVDLNATAVELAEISLWLDTMGQGLAAPWFGLHLKRGNSLIGARRAVFRRDALAKKAWLDAIPADRPLLDVATGEAAPVADGSIHHFLLPARGWGSAVDVKEAKELAPEALAELKAWRKRVLVTPSKKQADALAGLAQRVEVLWDFTIRRMQVAESFVRRRIDVWGADALPGDDAVSREEVEAYLADAGTAYRRLRLAMDAWCALWFWPLTEADVEPPDLDRWISGLTALLGTHVSATSSGRGKTWRGGDQTLMDTETWDALGEAEDLELGLSGAVAVPRVLEAHPWLTVVQRVAERQGFFHWELDFGSVFAGRGGFDLQVGNPPWVRPRSDVAALLAEADPWWQLKAKSTQAQDAEHREYALSFPGMRELVLEGTADVAVTAAFLGSAAQYPHLVGLQPDLYRCFMEQTWRHMSPSGPDADRGGSVGLIHLPSHVVDERAGALRAETYRRLRRCWQFINELLLFSEIEDHKRYMICVYGVSRDPAFRAAASLYHPETVVRSLQHDGSGGEPGIKDEDGRWDVRPHAGRIVHVTHETLRSWHAILEDDDVPVEQTRMVFAVNRATAAVLDKLSQAPRVGNLGLQFSAGWHETADRTRGRFDSAWGTAPSWNDVILQGPNLHIGLPFFKSPNASMRNNQDWSTVDLEALDAGTVPVTSYKPRGDRGVYDDAYTHWTRTVPVAEAGSEGSRESAPDISDFDARWIRDSETVWDDDGRKMVKQTVSARGFYRVAWRRMAANTGERTLIPAIIPPGAAHVDGISSGAAPGQEKAYIPLVTAFMSSLVLDFAVRAVPKGDIRGATVDRLPLTFDNAARPAILLRSLRLNGLTEAYSDLWTACWDEAFRVDMWASADHVRDTATLFTRADAIALGDVGPEWTPETPLRRATDRRRALLEIDALVALSLGITADELCTIYRTQFPVLYGYDRKEYLYDANGRLVPTPVQQTWRKKGGNDGSFAPDELTATHPGSGIGYEYVLPFVHLDREADLRAAYAEFERRLG